MTGMQLIAKTDQYREALMEMLPKLWEYTSKNPNVLDLFGDNPEDSKENMGSFDEGKKNLKCEFSLDAVLLHNHILTTYSGTTLHILLIILRQRSTCKYMIRGKCLFRKEEEITFKMQ